MKTSKAVLCYSYSEELATIIRKDEHLPAWSKIKWKSGIFIYNGTSFFQGKNSLEDYTWYVAREGKEEKEGGDRKGVRERYYNHDIYWTLVICKSKLMDSERMKEHGL